MNEADDKVITAIADALQMEIVMREPKGVDRRPDRGDLLYALAAAERTLRRTGSDWTRIDGKTRLTMLRTAHRLERLILRSGWRWPAMKPTRKKSAVILWGDAP